MAGRALAGQLNAAPRARRRASAPWSFRLAEPGDDAAARRLLREAPMDGAVRLRLECEPSFTGAAAVMGDRHQTLLACEPGGRVIAVACRAERAAFSNGSQTRLAYLSHLRVHRDFRGSPRLLLRGFDEIRALHEHEGGAPLSFASVMSDNAEALRILTAARGGLPRCRDLGAFATLILRSSPRRARSDGPAVRRGAPEDLERIAALLCARYRALQLAPRWTARDLESDVRTPDLRADDFLLVERGDELVGCAAVWDQRGFKQSVVDGYARPLGAARPAWNALARWTGAPRLPRPGAALAQAFLSHIALPADAREAEPVAVALVSAARRAAHARGIDLLALGLAAAHPLLATLRRRFRPRELEARLLLHFWPGGEAAARALDDRLPHVEVATL
ncbi:MAG: hypothetical protein AAF682_02495 [Planctomycetota bacterium]